MKHDPRGSMPRRVRSPSLPWPSPDLRLSRRRALAGAGAVTLLVALDGPAARADAPAAERPQTGSSPAAVDAAIQRIASARAALQTLRGPFTQTRAIGLLATDVQSHGILTLVRPDRLRWELQAPDDVTFWIGPEGLAYRSAHGHGKVPETSARVGAALDDMRALLGGDLGKLRERWNLMLLRDDATGIEMEATARAAAPGLSSMRFALAPDLVRPTRVILVEGPRDKTRIEFGELVVNGPVDPSVMRAPV
jgi:Outer membrane lipoprotein carrier protein LolA